MDPPADSVSRFERAKLLHDYFKYLTTISTGSVVFLGTFSKELSQAKVGMEWFAASIILFMVCVVSSVAAQTAYIWYASSEVRPMGKHVYLVGLFGSWAGLLGGVISLVVFALHRLP
jgi:hypothetical protein